jgi:uncharacterized protein (DUF488 family)
MARRPSGSLVVYSVGHSNQPLDHFLDLLRGHDIARIADVRAFPASRRWPHFGREPLAASLSAAGIEYEWLPELGGRRGRGRPDSPHTAWTVPAFRNYADHMESEEFGRGLARLLELATSRRTALLCAEARYWQCHRRLIADRLLVDGHRVLHIAGARRVSEHALPDFARVEDGRLVYDRGTQLSLP